MLSKAGGLAHRLPQPCQASLACISPAPEGESCPCHPSCLPVSLTMTPSHRLQESCSSDRDVPRHPSEDTESHFTEPVRRVWGCQWLPSTRWEKGTTAGLPGQQGEQ